MITLDSQCTSEVDQPGCLMKNSMAVSDFSDLVGGGVNTCDGDIESKSNQK